MTAAHKRMKGVTVYRVIVYGNSATPLTHVKNPPEVVPEGHTHQWTVSVRGPGNSDISHFVKKVVFKLHESFALPTRSIEEPPFEVTETGWGEFEIQIKIFFQPEVSEKPLTLFHFLHLHPYGPNKDEEKEQGTTIEAHQYDEIVFGDPTETFFETLTKHAAPPPPLDASSSNPYTKRSEAEEIARLNEAMTQVLARTEEYKKELVAKRKQLEEIQAAQASPAD